MATLCGARTVSVALRVSAPTVRSTTQKALTTYKIEAITGAVIAHRTTLLIATIAIITIKMVAKTVIVSQR